MKKQMQLNPAQSAAVDHLYGPLLVIAGPGTGKTQLLSARVVNILKQTDTDPGNILCLTFTESGATNMRTRLTSLIGRASAKVHIHTYHAFGRTILDAYQHYSDQPLPPRDQPIDNVTTHQILREIQSKLPLSDILKSANISDLSSTIRELKSARLTPIDAQKIAKYNLEASADLNSAISDLLTSLIPRKYTENLPIFEQILALLTTHISTQNITKSIEPEQNFLARDLKNILDEQATAEKPSISPLTKWRTTYFEKSDTGAYRSKNYISNRKLLSLANIYEQYQSALSEKTLYDYTDMIEQAIAHLAADPGFRASLEEKYQFILLDEFQDTNPSQFSLVQSLTTADQPNVMAVGDDDQAIMEFQGADASNLLTFQNHYNAKVITLTENYRSTQPILDFAKQISAQISDSFSTAHNIDKALTAHNTSDTSLSRHHFLAAPSEYDWLSAQIADLIKQGTSPSEIAILTPKHKYIPTLLPHLTARNIPISYEKRENILEDPRIESLLRLAEIAHALATGQQTAHLYLPLLAAPHWNIPPLSVITALDTARAERHSALPYLLASADPALSQLATFLSNLAARSLDTPLELFLDYLTGAAPLENYRSPFLEYYSATSDLAAFTLYENLSVLRETIINHTKKDTLRLADLVATMEAYAAAKEPITNTSPYQTAENAITILSVHKAKGLEFAHTFLISLDDAAWGNAGGNNNTLTLPKNLAHIRHTGITEDERLRLLFVAITRAKTHLYLTSSQSDFSGKSFIPLEYLEEHDGLSPLLPENSQQIIDHTDSATPLTAIKNHWSAPYHAILPDLNLMLKDRLRTYRLSPTDLTTFIDIVYAGPLTFFTQNLLRTPSDPKQSKVLYGSLIHGVLDHATKHKDLSDTDLLAHYAELVAATDITPEEKSELLEEGTTHLPAILTKLGPTLRNPTALSELNFRPDNIFLQGQTLHGAPQKAPLLAGSDPVHTSPIPLTGKIDLITIDEKAKEITIYDYKTSPFDPKKTWANNPTLFKYRLQLGFYKLLLNNSPKYSKYKVTGAFLEHISPDPHGNLTSRPYTFPPSEETELKSLITAVHHHITTLNFPDVPPDANHTLKDIKAFISTLLTPTP